MLSINIQKSIPVVGSYDVVVCGGGPGGMIAAVAAARSGARVALIERYGFLGGMATAGFVSPLSVFRYNDQLVIGGIPWEFICRMELSGGAHVEYPLGNISYRTESFKLEAQRMLLEAGVELYFHAWLSGCEQHADGTISHIIIESKSGTQAIEGKCFVDGTGDGDLCHMAGMPMQHFDTPLQPASMCFLLGGVEVERVEKIHHSQQGINYHNEPMQKRLREIAQTENVPNFGGPWFCWVLENNMLMVNATRIQANMVDEREQTRAECALREDVHTLVDILRRHFEPFKNAFLIATAPQAGVRETRHILGAHVLTGQEYASSLEFEDAIGRGAHPIDIHDASTTNQRCQFLQKAAYIPYRSLYNARYPNLLVASRCLSADREASASARVMASVMGVGQAAGLAAAMAAQTGVSVADVNTQTLRETLRHWGARI